MNNSQSVRRYQHGRTATMLAAVIGLAAAAVIAFAIAVATSSRHAPPETATWLPQPVALPEFTLTDGSGAAFTRDRFLGKTHLVFFGFTQCPDVCPLTLQKLALLRRQIEEGGMEPPGVVFVSVDPDRDSVERVAAYAGAFGDGFTGVRGSLEQLEPLTSTLGVYHDRPESADGYEVEHSAAVLVIGPGAGFVAVFSAPLDVGAMAADWPRLINAMETGG